ncbi:signal peptidase II [Clostridium rectalis]|uniref:signal peptidase II n=1 Tax=Clostridium rectalis TaxID=2040295 RepID=UPI000F63F875|nr:signal peptidase II [Clostridium rectalis]
MIVIMVVIGIIFDRLTKLWAIKNLSFGDDLVIIKDFFQFSYLENSGAAFGILKGRSIFLITITLIVIISIVFFMIKNKNKCNPLLSISLALIISGAIGNLIDRIQYKYVVDFILVHYKESYYFPTFNVADVLVSVGTFLLAIYVLKEDAYGR